MGQAIPHAVQGVVVTISLKKDLLEVHARSYIETKGFILTFLVISVNHDNVQILDKVVTLGLGLKCDRCREITR